MGFDGAFSFCGQKESKAIDLIGNKVLGVGNSCLARLRRAKQLFPIKFNIT
jgi:hypothetical protein